VAKPSGQGPKEGVLVAQKRITKAKRQADTRRSAREDEGTTQERPEIRKDLRHWFEER
jgi:hypothetical protein